MPSADPLPRYRIADLVVDVGRRTVLRGACEIHLSRLSFELLRTLLEAAPNAVSNEELTRKVWQGVIVGPETVTQRLKVLRDALGDDPASPRYIAGLRGHGYRILPEVTLNPAEAAPPSKPEPPPQALPNTHEPRPGETPRLRLAIVLGAAALVVGVTYLAIERAPSSRQGALHTAHARSTERSSAALPAHVSVSPVGEAFSPPPHSVAVLPFLNMSGDPRYEYFSDGVTEELLNSLSSINELQVVARTSSFSFKGKDTDIGTIARKLNVRAVLEGSVRRSGRTIRITAQLNDAVTGYHLWSQTYDRDLGDVLKLQTNIADAVANALRVTLLRDTETKIELGGTHSAAALDAFLRAGRAQNKDLQTAIADYSEAIRLDPKYALAFAARSNALSNYVNLATDPAVVHERFGKAQQDALKAIALAPDLAVGHVALAIYFESGSLDFRRANEEYERALTLAPGNAFVLLRYSNFAVAMGRVEAAVTSARRAVVLDPLNHESHEFLGQALDAAGKYAEAIAAYQDALGLNLDESDKYSDTYAERGLAYYALGNLQDALSSCESKTDSGYSRVCLAIIYRKLGRLGDADAMLAKLRASLGAAAAFQYAEIYAQWGKTSEALEWLEKGLRLRDPGLEYLKSDRLLNPLHKEPRFQAIEQSLKFPY
jgi:TolB-like protein/DNA-binding winged helix-turn-helix (wHTH) protein/Tfp pilus assembly protein PilF